MYEIAKNEDTSSIKCPLGQYILINLKNITATCKFCYIYILVVMNISQFVHKRAIQYIYSILIVLYVAKECIYQRIAVRTLFNEYSIFVLASIPIFWYLSGHSIGTILNRFIQVILYLASGFSISLLVVEVRDNNNFFSSMLF